MFFTADTHFNHENIISFCQRPFHNLEEMNETLIENWNAVVGKNDIVYHLGDFAFGTRRQIADVLFRLNGRIYLCIGSHDEYTIKCYADKFEDVQPYYLIKPHVKQKYADAKMAQPIFLAHYCYRVWPMSHYGSWHLYGHSHGMISSETSKVGKLLDVGVDEHNYYPWTLDEVTEIMNFHRPLNQNDIRNKI